MTLGEDILIDYVMGALSNAEEREVALYLNDHPEEAALVRDFFELLAVLALDQEPAHLPPDVEMILLRRIRQEKEAGSAGEESA